MKLLFFVVGVVAATVAGKAVLGQRGSRMVERPIGSLATVHVPARLEPRTVRSTWTGTTLHLTRSMNSFSAMGSNSPQHENLGVTQVEPRQTARLGDEVVRHVSEPFEYVRDVVWETPVTQGTGSVQLGAGRYTPNNMDRPAWLARGFDPARSLLVTYRVMQERTSREQVVALVDSVMSSYRLTGDVAEHFAGIERVLGGGVSIALPIELMDPFPWKFDASGVSWMYFRRARQWADDAELPEQTIAVTVFFAPGNAAQEQVARAILEREGRQGLTPGQSDVAADAAGIEVAAVEHRTGDRVEPSWLVTAIDAERGVGVTARVWQRDAGRADALALVRRALASYRFDGNAAEWFAPKAGAR